MQREDQIYVVCAWPIWISDDQLEAEYTVKVEFIYLKNHDDTDTGLDQHYDDFCRCAPLAGLEPMLLPGNYSK